MTYRINKTDGSLLSELTTGMIDQLSTSLTLIGNNYTEYGEFLNENFVKLLENFSNSNQPENPIKGQLWFDSSQSILKVYDGNQFKSSNGPIVKDSKPLNLVAGDIWIDSKNNKMWFYDGVDFIFVGPDRDYVKSRPISLCLHVGDRDDSNIDSFSLTTLEQVSPAIEYSDGTIARILCTKTDQTTKLVVYKLVSSVWTKQLQE
jgi:hypothetical protein